MLSRRDMNL